ncbi:hypothetical protein BHL85_07805 [Limosilactobacillus reuteri]|nr:hypothetical protein BHL74_08040 [Limosilactobacillus reuteri]OTA43751.1 hypothetical protein BHL74_08045 [Limosilactobacillus reuteri]OTA44018.1 hypothetical protein BHL85_07805 [Limosilactobacillus reuteri]
MAEDINGKVQEELASLKAFLDGIKQAKKELRKTQYGAQSWRFRYINWKRGITVADPSEMARALTEDQARILRMRIGQANRRLAFIRALLQRTPQDTAWLKSAQNELRGAQRDFGRVDQAEGSERYTDALTALRAFTDDFAGKLADFEQNYRRHQEQNKKYEDYQVAQKAYQDKMARYEDEVATAQQAQRLNAEREEQYAEAKKRYDNQLGKYEDYLTAQKAYEAQLSRYYEQPTKSDFDEWAGTLSDDAENINSNGYDITLVKPNLTKWSLEVVQSAPMTFSRAVMAFYHNYPNYGLGKALDDSVMDKLDNPDFSGAIQLAQEGDDEGARRLVESTMRNALDQYVGVANEMPELKKLREVQGKPRVKRPVAPEQVARPEEPERPRLFSVEEPQKPQEPEKIEVPKPVEPFTLQVPEKISNLTYSKLTKNSVPADLIDTLDEFTRGPYAMTIKNRESINALAQKIKSGCPTFEEVAENYDQVASRCELPALLGQAQQATRDFGTRWYSKIGHSAFEATFGAIQGASVADKSSMYEAYEKVKPAYERLSSWYHTRWYQAGGSPHNYGVHVTKKRLKAKRDRYKNKPLY